MSYSSGQPGPSEPSYRLLGALVNATVPATRKRRDETAEQRAERKMLQEEMEDIAADIVER